MNVDLRMGSAGDRHIPLIIEGKRKMLARRFTIVCLLVALFGMSLAMLVAEKSRYPHPYMNASSTIFSLCDSGGAVGCPR